VADRMSHGRHDRFAIAAAVGSGLVPATVGGCPACGALHGDLLAIRTAIRHAWIPARPRDLRLTAADDARLRPTGLWRRLMDALGTSRDTVSRPLAMSLTGLGLAGLLLTTVPVDSSGAATAEYTPVDIYLGAAVGASPSTAAPPERSSANAPGDEPLVVLSAGLLAAGGGILVLRRRAAHRVRGT
jgi:hypothetical protein